MNLKEQHSTQQRKVKRSKTHRPSQSCFVGRPISLRLAFASEVAWRWVLLPVWAPGFYCAALIIFVFCAGLCRHSMVLHHIRILKWLLWRQEIVASAFFADDQLLATPSQLSQSNPWYSIHRDEFERTLF